MLFAVFADFFGSFVKLGKLIALLSSIFCVFSKFFCSGFQKRNSPINYIVTADQSANSTANHSTKRASDSKSDKSSD